MMVGEEFEALQTMLNWNEEEADEAESGLGSLL